MKKILVAALLLLTNFAIAQPNPDSVKKLIMQPMPQLQKGVYVTDFTKTLTSDQVQNLNQRAAEIKQKTGFELVIVVMDALPRGMDVNDATAAVNEQWNPGDNVSAERLVYIAGLKQHGHRLNAANGAKSVILFDKAECTKILSAMRPDYDKHNYYDGLQIMVDQISERLHVDTGQSSMTSSTNIYIGAVILAIIFILYAWFRSRKKETAA